VTARHNKWIYIIKRLKINFSPKDIPQKPLWIVLPSEISGIFLFTVNMNNSFVAIVQKQRKIFFQAQVTEDQHHHHYRHHQPLTVPTRNYFSTSHLIY